MHFFNIKYTLILLNILGSHPGKVESKGQTFLYYSIFISTVIIIFLTGMNTFNSNISSVEIATTLAECFVFLHPATKMHMIYVNRSTIWQLLVQMDNKFWNIKDKTTKETRKYYEQVLNRLKNMFRFFCLMLSTWVVTTISLSDLPIKCYVPKWIPVRSLIILEDVLCVLIAVALLCTDMLFMTIVTMLSLQVRMLNENLRSVFDYGSYDKRMHEKLNDWIEHHCFVLKYVDAVNKAFSRGMVAYLGNVVGVLCTYIYFLSISDTSNIVSVIPIIIVILVGYLEFVYCYCVPAQHLMNEVEKTNETVYLANWVQHLEHSSSVILITVRCQKGVALTAGGFGKLSLETCMRVLKTVISYYMFLKTIIDE